MSLQQRPLSPFKQESRTYVSAAPRRLVQRNRSTVRWLHILLDLIVVISLLLAHTWLRNESIPHHYEVLAVMTILLMLIIYEMNGVYMDSLIARERLWRMAKSWAMVIASLMLVGFVTKTSEDYSREVILTWSATGFVGQVVVFFFVARLQTLARVETIRTLMVGTGGLAQHLTEHVNSNEWLQERIVGVVGNDDRDCRSWEVDDVPILGRLEDIEQVIHTHDIRRVYIAVPLERAGLVQDIYQELLEQNVDVIWAPDIFGIDLINHSIRELAGAPLITLSESPLVGTNEFIKQIYDYTFASLALIVLSPLMLLIAVAIKVSSKGPVLFIQKRHGWDGRIINVFKFRSMRLHEEVGGVVVQAKRIDDRVTPVGRIIRRTSLDELPQLFNVLNGTMSLVGPRPHAVAHNKQYGDQIRAYMLRHRIKPGITGLAQVNGLRGETRTVEAMEQRVQMDLAYINNWSVWLDFKIMFRTVFVLFGSNVY